MSEFKIGKYKVDGYDEITKTVYEFHGCWYHGCPKCFNPKTINPFKQETMEILYKKTKEKETFIKSKGYNYVEIWEHEWDDRVECISELSEFVKKQNIRPPLNPRDALFGGRTNASHLYYQCNNDEKIQYYDFTSLYPYVQKTQQIPLGQPTIITEYFDSDFNNYFGIVQCKILPPQNL